MDMWSARGARCDSTRELIRRFHHSEFDLSRLLERKTEPITVVLPAREVADTVGEIVERLRGLDPLIDQVLVVDAGSRDGTGEIAARAGADVHQEAELMPEFGQVLGKGDAMWRALSVARGELVAYLDSDTRDFLPHFALGMLGPLICEPDVRFVKAFFRRPYGPSDGAEPQADGGRVTELTARPLLSAFFPELAGFVQPLAGEVAARRTLFERIRFATGYAVETAMLLHARDALGGTGGMAQVDLDVRLNSHQPLRNLSPMAYAVLRVILERLRAEGRLLDDAAPPLQTADGGLVQVEIVERPPHATLRARA
jgi:glucosyl-3-phosphoglycerate synthase